MIVRVNDSTTYLNMVKYMGGTGTAMSQSEGYTALQQGVIDAGENELEPANILCADVAKETSAGIIHIIETADDIPMATPIGAPITSSTTNIVTITKATCNAILIFTSYSAFFLSSRPILYML